MRNYWKYSCKDYGTNLPRHLIHSPQIMGRETRIVTVALISFQSIGRILSMQGVVTLISPVEPFATGIKSFDWLKFTLIS